MPLIDGQVTFKIAWPQGSSAFIQPSLRASGSKAAMKESIHPKWYPDAKVIALAVVSDRSTPGCRNFLVEVCPERPIHTGTQSALWTPKDRSTVMRRPSKARGERSADADRNRQTRPGCR